MDEEDAEVGSSAATARVEIGWVLSGDWQQAHREAAVEAAERMRARLMRILGVFTWTVSVVERPDHAPAREVEPVLLLDDAEVERDRHGWDFAIIATERDLVSYTRPMCFAAPSRVLSAAVLSTAHLADTGVSAEDLSARLFGLAMHLFGRLNGLEPEEGEGFMHDFASASDLARMDGFSAAETDRLRRNLEYVADPRVEEMPGRRRLRAAFYLRSVWENRAALPQALLRMRPWAFPVRLSRLTTAAVSALAIVLMTAEAWEVAAHHGIWTLVLLSMVTLVATSAYLLRAQHLLARPGAKALSEQRAVTNVSTVVAVLMGMAVTYLAIFAIAWAGGAVLFADAVLSRWTGEGAHEEVVLRLHMAVFTAALSLVIGALGASFEPHGYFRHVTYIDDEV